MERSAEIAVVYSEPRVTDRVLDLLWMEKLTVLCHPDVAARGEGQSLSQFLSSNDLLKVAIDDRPRNQFWEMTVKSVGCPDVNVDRGLVFDTSQMAVLYAMSGEGLALVDPLLFQSELASGKLVGRSISNRKRLWLFPRDPPGRPRRYGRLGLPHVADQPVFGAALLDPGKSGHSPQYRHIRLTFRRIIAIRS